MSEPGVSSVMLKLTTQIVVAHVSNNRVDTDGLTGLIQSVFRSLSTASEAPEREATAELKPAVSVKKSVFPDYIICLEDGQKLKMLKRHLQTSYGMTPDAYRTKWGLPQDYPMVAPNYTATRSNLAKKIGLGRKASGRAAQPSGPVDAADGEVPVQHIPARRAKGSK